MYGYLLATIISTSLARSASVAATSEATGDLSQLRAQFMSRITLYIAPTDELITELTAIKTIVLARAGASRILTSAERLFVQRIGSRLNSPVPISSGSAIDAFVAVNDEADNRIAALALIAEILAIVPEES